MGSSQPRDRTHVCCTAGKFFTSWATREAWRPILVGIVGTSEDAYMERHCVTPRGLWLPATDTCLHASVQFSSVQSLSGVWLFATPWTAACQASLSITNSQSLPKISHKVNIKSLKEKLQSRKEDYFSWSSRLGLTALHSQRNRDAW